MRNGEPIVVNVVEGQSRGGGCCIGGDDSVVSLLCKRNLRRLVGRRPRMGAQRDQGPRSKRQQKLHAATCLAPGLSI